VSRNNKNIGMLVDFVGLIRRAPRTAIELVSLTGIGRNTIDTYPALFVEEGLIEKIGRRNVGPARWQDEYRWRELSEFNPPAALPP
jgi:hypothetical protein